MNWVLLWMLRAVVVPLPLCAGLALGDTPHSQTITTFSLADQKVLRMVALKVKEAVLNEDIEGVLAHVSKTKGLTCTDTIYSYEEVRAFLHNKQSHLYMSLFDSVQFSRQCGGDYPSEYPAIADQEFLRTANESVTVTRLDNDWARISLTSPIGSHYPREWYFHREAGTWKLAGGSLVLGRCSCG
jgi:hypothetical protein